MKKALFILLILFFGLSCSLAQDDRQYCLTGAFLSDNPSEGDIINFKNTFGKKPYLVMVFLDWGGFLDKKTIDAAYGQGCSLLVTWEPWKAREKKGINFDGLLSGKFDGYIKEFALRLKDIQKPVFLRFAHEPNGNWYPWEYGKIGKEKYAAVFRYIHGIFRQAGAANVKWIFCLNWEDVPGDNSSFLSYYPGDDCVDYVGLDGYNWGNTQSWSRWMSFNEIFTGRYQEVVLKAKKPVIISEFGSASKGGNKAVWIKEAMAQIKKMDNVRGFVLFNVDKEADWKFEGGSLSAVVLKEALNSNYFQDCQ